MKCIPLKNKNKCFFALMKVQINDQIVKQLVKPGMQHRFIPFEELFDIVHIEKGHFGRDTMQKHMSTRHSNVTVQHINIYRGFCEKCGLQKSKARGRGVVVKPISSSNVMSRGQVDLV